ncbi:hypothetical protein H4582DRAFT_1412995 [Lactarius indigo]|nr:hypothetical protein H4582DRAFT_1412995 [Lactarius indigo]
MCTLTMKCTPAIAAVAVLHLRLFVSSCVCYLQYLLLDFWAHSACIRCQNPATIYLGDILTSQRCCSSHQAPIQALACVFENHSTASRYTFHPLRFISYARWIRYRSRGCWQAFVGPTGVHRERPSLLDSSDR